MITKNGQNIIVSTIIKYSIKSNVKFQTPSTEMIKLFNDGTILYNDFEIKESTKKISKFMEEVETRLFNWSFNLAKNVKELVINR